MTTSPVSSNALATLPTANSQALGVPVSGLAVVDQINKADIIAIVRSEAEERLIESQNDANKRLSSLTSKIAILNTTLDESARGAVDQVDTSDVDAAAASLKDAFGIKTEVKVELTAREDEHKRFRITVSLVNQTTSSYRDTIGTREVTIPFSKSDIEALKDIKNLQKEVTTVQAELLNVKKEIGNLGALERRAHAELARHVLQQSLEGQRLLSRLRPVRPVVAIVA